MNLRPVLSFLLGAGREYPVVDFSVTVLVPAYNEEPSIAKTIRSLKEQTYPVMRILVINDCSTDATAQIARSLGADVITTPAQTGTKAQAQNYALPFVDTDVVVTVDADTYLAPDAIERILPPLQDNQVVSVCGFVIPQKIETFWERARYVDYLFGISIHKQAQSNWGITMVSSGCFSAYKTDSLKQWGGFPPRTVVEDMDLTWLQLEQGYKTLMEPRAKCYPLDPHNWATYEAQLDRWFRGYFQVIALHKRELLRNKRHALFTIWGLVEGLAYPVSVLATIILLANLHNHSMILSALTASVLGVAVVSASTLLQAAEGHCIGLAMQSLPCYFLVRPVNSYLFWRALILEWVLGRKLSTWNKGH